MANVTAGLTITANTSQANAALKSLQSQMAAAQTAMVTGNRAMATSTAANAKSYASQAKAMGAGLAATGMFTSGISNVRTEMGRMNKDFDTGNTSFRKYRQQSMMWTRQNKMSAGSASKMNRLAADRVKMLQTQTVALGKEVNGVQKTMQIRPTGMMKEFGGQAQYAAQRMMLFRRNLDMGASHMINWGKNTQWAGRQMMVGMGIPIALAAAGAVSSFKDIEEASVSFKRVYGDATTTAGDKAQALQKIQKGVGIEMTKYGISVADTLDVSARAAATGAQGAELETTTREVMRLATLGQMDYQQALEATIAAQSTFGIKSKDMARNTDFLNAAENQTILTMEDMALAVPRAANSVKMAGGEMEDLATMMTAFRVGGVQSEQAANALKSGIASMINPTETAKTALGGMGISLDKIVKNNKGDVVGMFKDLGTELDGLSKFEAGQALEKMFGKFQYSKIGAMIANLKHDQVKEIEKLGSSSAEALAQMSETELKALEDSPLNQMKGAVERLKEAVAPLGGKVLEFLTPLVNGIAKVAGFFAGNDIARNIMFMTVGLTGLIGVGTMLTGVFANFFGTLIKGGMKIQSMFARLIGKPIAPWVSSESLKNATATNQLAGAAKGATASLYAEAGAAKALTSALSGLAGASANAAQAQAGVASRRKGGGTKGGGTGGGPKPPQSPPVNPPTSAVPVGTPKTGNQKLNRILAMPQSDIKTSNSQVIATPGIGNKQSTFQNYDELKKFNEFGPGMNAKQAQLLAQQMSGATHKTTSAKGAAAYSGAMGSDFMKGFLRTDGVSAKIASFENMPFDPNTKAGVAARDAYVAKSGTTSDQMVGMQNKALDDYVAKNGSPEEKAAYARLKDPAFMHGRTKSERWQVPAGEGGVAPEQASKKAAQADAALQKSLDDAGRTKAQADSMKANDQSAAHNAADRKPVSDKLYQQAQARDKNTAEARTKTAETESKTAETKSKTADAEAKAQASKQKVAQRSTVADKRLLAADRAAGGTPSNYMPLPGQAEKWDKETAERKAQEKADRARKNSEAGKRARLEAANRQAESNRAAARAKRLSERTREQVKADNRQSKQWFKEREAREASQRETTKQRNTAESLQKRRAAVEAQRAARGAAPLKPGAGMAPAPPAKKGFFSKMGRGGGGMMGAGMAAMMATSAASMSGAELPTWMTVAPMMLMGAGAAKGLLPTGLGSAMAPVIAALGPFGIAIGAAAAVMGGAFLALKFFENRAVEAAEHMAELSVGSKDAVDGLGEAYGTSSLFQKVKDRKDAKRLGVHEEDVSEARKIAESDFGKTLKEDFSTVLEDKGKDSAIAAFSNNLASGILQGVVTSKQANALASQLLGPVVSGGVKTSLAEFVGRDGELLNKDVFKPAMNLLDASMEVATEATAERDATIIPEEPKPEGLSKYTPRGSKPGASAPADLPEGISPGEALLRPDMGRGSKGVTGGNLGFDSNAGLNQAVSTVWGATIQQAYMSRYAAQDRLMIQKQQLREEEKRLKALDEDESTDKKSKEYKQQARTVRDLSKAVDQGSKSQKEFGEMSKNAMKQFQTSFDAVGGDDPNVASDAQQKMMDSAWTRLRKQAEGDMGAGMNLDAAEGIMEGMSAGGQMDLLIGMQSGLDPGAISTLFEAAGSDVNRVEAVFSLMQEGNLTFDQMNVMTNAMASVPSETRSKMVVALESATTPEQMEAALLKIKKFAALPPEIQKKLSFDADISEIKAALKAWRDAKDKDKFEKNFGKGDKGRPDKGEPDKGEPKEDPKAKAPPPAAMPRDDVRPKGRAEPPATITQQVIRKIGKDESKNVPKGLKQDIRRYLKDDKSKKMPKALKQKINRFLGKDPSKKLPKHLRQLIDRKVNKDDTKKKPDPMTQEIGIEPPPAIEPPEVAGPAEVVPTWGEQIPAQDGVSPTTAKLTPSWGSHINAQDAITGSASISVNVVKASLGGLIPDGYTLARRAGGFVSGDGGPNDDKIPAMLSNGEYVIRAKAVDKYGTSLMARINTMRYATGGAVGFKEGGSSDKGKSWKKDVIDPLKKDTATLGREISVLFKKGIGGGLKTSIREIMSELIGDSKKMFNKAKTKGGKKQIRQLAIKKYNQQQDSDLRGAKREFTDESVARGQIGSQYLDKLKSGRFNKNATAARNLSVEEIGMFTNHKGEFKKSKKKGSPGARRKGGKQQLNKYLELKLAAEDAAAERDFMGEESAGNKRAAMFSAPGNKAYESEISNLSDEEVDRMSRMSSFSKEDFLRRKKALTDQAKIMEDMIQVTETLKSTAKSQHLVGLQEGLLNAHRGHADVIAGMGEDELEVFERMNGSQQAAYLASKRITADAAKRVAKQAEIIQEWMESPADALQKIADFRVEEGIRNAFGGKTRTEMDAYKDSLSYASEQEQRSIELLNREYEDQEKSLEKIEQHQQQIANIEKGRLSVAQALSVGDIAAAARAMQEAKQEEASIGREQMRAAIQESKDARIKVHEDRIEKLQDLIWNIENKMRGVEVGVGLDFAKQIGDAAFAKMAGETADLIRYSGGYAIPSSSGSINAGQMEKLTTQVMPAAENKITIHAGSVNDPDQLANMVVRKIQLMESGRMRKS